ncbi:putative HTH-type transcriptional regulator [Pseudomonas reidholzensis]|uniref:Putative HTH-type transcriptional regulator n=1 Tax=Pseudomonas reidholzensis TaxID=1785162 RepID=A0A383RW85_9PSED|nr:PLP-dependent aminotransferase family protein [Pseudomonas reidholzensis]SYX90648.1 putative HTH-type transcriptional regulator [Pseudomonas reidholzensis]
MPLAEESKKTAQAQWIRPFKAKGGARYIQIADMIAESIQSGSLQAGDQVPPQRTLAAELGVDLTTVTRAYAEARNRGLIASYGGRGSFVMGASAPGAQARIDLTMNIPPQPANGSMAERVGKGLEEVLRRQRIEALSTYQDEPGTRSAVQAGQAWLQPALGDLDLRGLSVCAGSQAAIFAILSSTTRPGDSVLCDPLTYPGLLLAARQLGLRVVAVEGDADGMRPDALERAQQQSGARLLYLNPTFNNPTAQTMPAGRRAQIAATLLRLQLTLIEDDPYRYLLDDAPAPIATLTGGANTYYLASLSKCLWPSLRTSFVLPPRDDDGDRLHAGLRAASMGCSGLLLGLVEHWIRSGTAKALVEEIQREARARQQLARSLLSHEVQTHPSGLHLWLPLPAHWNQSLFTHALDEVGVNVAGADSFSVSAQAQDAVRVSLGGAADQASLGLALRKIEALLKEDRRRNSRAFV